MNHGVCDGRAFEQGMACWQRHGFTRTAAVPDFSARSMAPSSDKRAEVSAQPVMANLSKAEFTLSLGSSANVCGGCRCDAASIAGLRGFATPPPSSTVRTELDFKSVSFDWARSKSPSLHKSCESHRMKLLHSMQLSYLNAKAASMA